MLVHEMSEKEVSEYQKSSAEILSELFSAFNAKPPKTEHDSDEKSHKKHKKSKKKHKKEKKHKKKSKHRHSSPDSSSTESKHKKRKFKDLNFDFGELFNIKKENDDENTEILTDFNFENVKIKQEPIEVEIKIETNTNSTEIEKSSETNIKPVEKSNKITIKDLKNSVLYEKTIKEIEENKIIRVEDGEITDSDSGSKSDEILNDHILDGSFSVKKEIKNEFKRKHSDHDKYDNKKSKKDRDRDKKEKHHRHRSRSREREKHHKKRERDSRDDYFYSKSYSYRSYSDYDRYRYKHEKRRSTSRDRSRSKIRSRSRSADRSRTSHRRRSPSPSSSIDKKKLLEIARRNAISMLKSGTLPDALTLGPQAQEKVIAAIKAGGKTIEELTDFCKNLSKKEALGELSSVSSAEDDIDSDTENGVEKVFHHPFQIKDKPASIVMNIKNATPLPIKTSKEKSAELRLQFPVSSGQLHRKTESEWVPVQSKPEPVPATPVVPPVLVPVGVPAPVVPVTEPVPTPAALPVSSLQSIAVPEDPQVDISTIVSQRLSAMRKLQENPNDIQALTQMQRVQKDMENWAQSKQQPGQFTGSTGANILSAAELASGYQAWARKDQLQNAAPVMGGMGMHLLQKMGWRPGEGLGKEKSGQLEPLLLEVKLDKKGLVAGGEVKNKKPAKTTKTATTKTLVGKHPVSLLGEYASKKKLGVPQYEVCFECGPDHKKNFLFKVILNGVEYKPNVVSSTKKQAKADAATICLQHLGVLPS